MDGESAAFYEEPQPGVGGPQPYEPNRVGGNQSSLHHEPIGSFASTWMAGGLQSKDLKARIPVDALPSGSAARAAAVAAAAAAARSAQANRSANDAQAALVAADAELRAQAARDRRPGTNSAL